MSAPAAAATAVPTLAQHLRAEAHNNAWANHRLLAACAALTPEAFAAPRTSFFPSIKATLNHILTVDWFYLDALERARSRQAPNERPGVFFEPEEPFDRCPPLAEAQREADRRLIAYCDGLNDGNLDEAVRIRRGSAIKAERASRLLAHLFQHQIHHRGQAHAMLAGTAVKPPQLDEFYCSDEARLRAGDFAELGFTEEAIWGERAAPPE